MINQLKKIFPSLVAFDSDFSRSPQEYKWYITDKDEILGIEKLELTSKDEALLGTFLSPYTYNVSLLTSKERFWHGVIHDDNSYSSDVEITPYRFVHFSFQQNDVDSVLFKEAINSIFSKQLPILWLTNDQGIIIEEEPLVGEDQIKYNEIIDILMSDLYVKIRFFVGPFLTELEDAKQLYTLLIKGASTAFAYSDKLVISYDEALPYLLVDQVDASFREETRHFLLKEVLDDKELINTIKTFFVCNLNITLTAKELYMHRNSLQYRIDKFIEKTGVDIRQFHQAATVFLALATKK
ncbi:PucR family transcriptional regulator [Virgibacillus flavescens]|uniref:PucR family transcriptional regulator n=1 Tax=Virgibacillus flavescens TaxID=1611422 RepID=UPI003D34CBDF